jgi:hypothetical protein
MKPCVLSVIVEFSLLAVCEFCIQNAPLGRWFIVMPNAMYTARCCGTTWQAQLQKQAFALVSLGSFALLKVAINPAACKQWLNPHLARFSAKHGGLNIPHSRKISNRVFPQN